MVSARDFRVGELVRFEDSERIGYYSERGWSGQLCLIVNIEHHHNMGDKYDTVTLRRLSDGQEVGCYVTRIRKAPTEEQADAARS